MIRLFQSLDAWFKGLTYSKKFTVITVIFLLPILAFLPLIGTEVTRINRYGTQELFGALYTRPLAKTVHDLYLHKVLSQAYADGEVELSVLQALQATIDDDFAQIEARQRQEILSEPYQGEVAGFNSRWQEIRNSVLTGGPPSLQTHQELINDFNDLLIRVGEDSNLVLDPDLDTYYMMDLVLFDLPEIQSWTLEIYELADLAGADQPLDARQQEQIAGLMQNIETNMVQIDRKISVALANNTNGAMMPIIAPAWEVYRAQVQTYADFLQTNVLTGSTDALSAGNLRAFQEVHAANHEFHLAAFHALQTGVSERVNSSILRFYPIALVALASAAGAFLLGQSMMSSISQPLVQLARASQQLASGDLSARVAAPGTGEIEKVSRAFNQMATELEADKMSLTQRARELELANQINASRAWEFQVISEISQVIAGEQKLEILLPLITRLVSDKFSFYHVGIFLTDESRQFAVLQASNSEGGKKMLNRSHRIELGTGVVGGVAQSGSSRIALDVGAEAVFFDNPDLPATRSELALPLQTRGVTIGVLDVQSTRSGEFTESVVNTLGILADQIAIAIENARLFTRTQQALEEVQALYNQYVQKEWAALQARLPNAGYWQSLSGGKPLEVPVETDDIRHALNTGQTLNLKSNGVNADPTIIAPIKLRGHIIGVLNIRSAAKNREWTRDELNLIQSVADRIALALENARLFEDTSRRAERERLVSEITGKIRSVNDPQAMIRTALEELQQALGASRVQVIPQSVPDAKSNQE